MSIERKLLKACLKDRPAYEITADLIPTGDFTPLGSRILKAIGEYYEHDKEAQYVDADIIHQNLDRKFEQKEHKQQLKDAFDGLASIEVSPNNVIQLCLNMRRSAVGIKLAEQLLNEAAPEDIGPLLEEYNKLVEAQDLSESYGEEYSGAAFSELIDVIDPSKKIKLAPQSLNERLGGGLVPGDAMILAGRPNAGKTAEAITIMCALAYRGHKVMYAGNEDAIKKIIVRCLSCLTGRTEPAMLSDPEGTMELARERGYDNIVFVHLSPGTPEHLRALVRKHRPLGLIVDQVRNLDTSTRESRVNQLDAAGRAIRSIGGEFGCITIMITQVGESGDGKLILDMTDIDSSKTGLQGACDVMLMIGVNNEWETNHSRMMSLPKNKVGESGQAWPVKINEKLSRYYDE